MKKLIFCLMAAVLITFTSCAQNVIGKISDGKYIITIKTDEIKVAGEKHLASKGIKTVLTTFEILQDKVEGNGDIYYLLLAQNSDGSVKLGTTLELKGSQFISRGVSVFERSASCSGCPRGCSPRRTVGPDNTIDFYCTDCTRGSGCTKTETSD